MHTTHRSDAHLTAPHRSRLPARLAITLLYASAVLTLHGCGGGGGAVATGATENPLAAAAPVDTVTAAPAASTTITGAVVDGPIEGATVFLDLNGNQVYDSGEPLSQPTDTAGAFSLSIEGLSAAQVAAAMLVTHVPSTARDADDGGLDLLAAGRKGFSLMAPAAAFVADAAASAPVVSPALLSPLTTLVAGAVANEGKTLEQAKAAVAERLGLGTKNPMSNFVAHPDQVLGQAARVVAIGLGETASRVAEAARVDGGQSVSEQMATTLETLRTALPQLMTQLDGGAMVGGRPVPVANVLAQLAQSTERPTAPAQTTTPTPAPTPVETPVEPDQTTAVTVATNTTNTGTTATDTPTRPGASKQEFRNYVVRFKEGTTGPDSQARSMMAGSAGQIRFTYTHVMQGFAVTLPDAAADAFIDAMARHPLVDSVEVDQDIVLRQVTQTSATWGLDRIDQRALPLDTSFSYGSDGTGVHAYVVDTGILATHTAFGGRVTDGFTAITDGNGTTDCNGHGTHVAGTIGSTPWGVAKGVTLVPVRVLTCAGSGLSSGLIAGLDWVAKNGQRPAVVNMSLGGGAMSTIDSAVAKLVSMGITVVVAAGNSSADACTASPSREPTAITVGATGSNDARASYSNFGTCVDVFAPGTSITSTWISSTTASNTISGTSMASPHVAGHVAQILQARPDASPAQVVDALKTAATANVVSNAGAGSPNLLLNTSSSVTGVSPPPPPPDQPPVDNPVLEWVSVGSLNGSAAPQGKGWRATVSVAVVDAKGQAVAGAVVSGGFTSGGSNAGCTTSSAGTCSVTSGNLSAKRISSTVYTVSSITGNGLGYAAPANVASSVTIGAP